MKTTTLKEIKKAKPCKEGWEKLLSSLGKTKADDAELSLEYILKSNNLADACWVANNVMDLDMEMRLLAYWNAKQSKKYVDDKKAYNKVINTVNLYAYGDVGDSAKDSARASARDSYMGKAEKAFIDIVCNGKLPAKVKTNNHF